MENFIFCAVIDQHYGSQIRNRYRCKAIDDTYALKLIVFTLKQVKLISVMVLTICNKQETNIYTKLNLEVFAR